ncbi:MAG: hypothetical protein JW953_18720 [Anaerolineae bacterium]|nr:hypothetical protein [Anaerolineae bacterium]
MNKVKKVFLPILPVLFLLLAAHLVLAQVLGNNHLNISKATIDAGYPAIAVSQNQDNIGMVWADRYPGGNAAQGPIYIKMANDGYTLDRRFTVDNSNSVSDQSWAPAVASDPINQANMHVVWTNLREEGGKKYYTIYYALCQTTAASSCSQETKIQEVNNTDDFRVVSAPKIAVSQHPAGTALHVVWQFIDSRSSPTQTLIYYSGKPVGASSWTQPFTVSNDPSLELASHPAIAVSRDATHSYLHVAWASDTDRDNKFNEQIKYKRATLNATSGGVTGWSGVQQFVKYANQHPDYPYIVAISNTVMLVWDELSVIPTPSSWPADEQYYAIYNLSEDSGVNFDGAKDFYTPAVKHRSDPNPSSSDENFHKSPHAGRLQIQVAAELVTTPVVTTIVHAVWHETNNAGASYWHDVRYSLFEDGEWSYPSDNETENKKFGSNPGAQYYSMSPRFTVVDGDIYALYMEGKEEGEYQLDEPKVFDVIYNGTVALTDTTTNNPTDQAGGPYLPIIVKRRS